MENKNSVKNRFDQLKEKSSSISSSPAQTEKVVSRLELTDSTQPELHALLRSNKKTASYNWREVSKTNFYRPAHTSRPAPLTFKFQEEIRKISKSSVLFSFYCSDKLDHEIAKLLTHVHARAPFWSGLFSAVSQCHLRVEKNKLQIWLRPAVNNVEKFETTKSILQNEYFTNSHFLKSYNVTKSDEWIEMNLELSDNFATAMHEESYV